MEKAIRYAKVEYFGNSQENYITYFPPKLDWHCVVGDPQEKKHIFLYFIEYSQFSTYDDLVTLITASNVLVATLKYTAYKNWSYLALCFSALGITRQRPISYTHMLLPVREDLPETREELNPGPLSQRRGDMTKLDQSVQKSPRLTQKHREMTAADSARQWGS